MSSHSQIALKAPFLTFPSLNILITFGLYSVKVVNLVIKEYEKVKEDLLKNHYNGSNNVSVL